MTPLPRALTSLGLVLMCWTGGRVWWVTATDETKPRPRQEVTALVRMTPIEKEKINRPLFESPRTRSNLVAVILPRNISGADRDATKVFPQPIGTGFAIPSRMTDVPGRAERDSMHADAPLSLPSERSSVWSGSSWLIFRPEGGVQQIVSNGQLGGSQVGLRIQARISSIWTDTGIALNGRFSSPLQRQRGKEAALGISIKRDGALPIELLVERRLGLDRGGRDAFALLAATGMYDRPIGSVALLSGYAQAGAVGMNSRDAFIDGAARLERRLQSKGPELRVGLNAWGAAQPGVHRVDIGPSVATHFPVAQTNFRLSLEWRHRIAGQAEPGSGPSISLGTDF